MVKVFVKADFDRVEQCKENLQFQAIVNIQLASQMVNNITRDRRLTESDQLSNLGKVYFYHSYNLFSMNLPKLKEHILTDICILQSYVSFFYSNLSLPFPKSTI